MRKFNDPERKGDAEVDQLLTQLRVIGEGAEKLRAIAVDLAERLKVSEYEKGRLQAEVTRLNQLISTMVPPPKGEGWKT